MKKAFVLIILALILVGVAFWVQSGIRLKKAEASNKIDNGHIYFFYQERCPHCHHSRDYIKEKYPNLKVEYRDIAVQANWPDFMECAKKFNVPEDQLGTPLICMGKNFILGWSEKDQNNFDKYVKSFLK